MPRRNPKSRKNDARRAASTRRRKMSQRRSQAPPPAAERATEGPVRLNRFIAQAGIASRRKADELIAAGLVTVNGEVVTELGTQVGPEARVEVEGRLIRPQALEYVLLNKPRDTITTVEDERDRATVMDLLDEAARRRGVVPVGRLDRDSTGALLLTNDGDLAHRLMHPRYGVEKLYVVRTARPVSPEDLARLAEGVELEDGPARADQAAYAGEDRREVGLALHEGRNRQVRRMMEALGHEVERLERVQFAGLTLEGLRRGRWRRLRPHEINRLRRLVKLKPIVM